MTSLIVYFSHTGENYVDGSIKALTKGNTYIVAEKIAKKLQSDLFEIKALHEYPFTYGPCTTVAKKELQEQARPKILNIVSHMESYDTIFLGYPNWWGTMPMCVWTFLESYDLKGKMIFPFCTHEGSALGNSIKDIQTLCPNSIVKEGLALYGSQVMKADADIEAWLKRNEVAL